MFNLNILPSVPAGRRTALAGALMMWAANLLVIACALLAVARPAAVSSPLYFAALLVGHASLSLRAIQTRDSSMLVMNAVMAVLDAYALHLRF